MKICFIGDTNSIHFVRWVRFFVDRQHNVSVISFNNSPGIKGAKTYYIKLYRFNRLSIPLQNILSWRVVVKIARLVYFKIKPDILHAHYVTDFGFYASATGFHPLVISAWGGDVLLDPEVSSIYRSEAKYALKRANLITVDCEYIKEKILFMSKTRRNSIYNIQWGMDFENYGNVSEYNNNLKKELGLRENTPVILCARGFQERCNTDIIIKSVSDVIKEVPDARFVLLGGWGQWRKEDYEKLAKEQGVDKYILFPGFIEYKNLFSFYNISKIMLSVTSLDGTPASLLEGMACGCIPIVSDIPPHCEWIENGVNGAVVKLRDSKDLSKSIIEMLKLSEKECEQIKNYNYQLVQEKGNHKNNMLYMEKLYLNLISDK
ncbi:MAG: glycosyltransferase family 4 protein [bacterium]|nr:glycosyltransferase family 4 protein [bacterium]